MLKIKSLYWVVSLWQHNVTFEVCVYFGPEEQKADENNYLCIAEFTYPQVILESKST